MIDVDDAQLIARNVHRRCDGLTRRLDQISYELSRNRALIMKLRDEVKVNNGRLDRFKQIRRESNERIAALEAAVAGLCLDFVPVRPILDAHLERVQRGHPK